MHITKSPDGWRFKVTKLKAKHIAEFCYNPWGGANVISYIQVDRASAPTEAGEWDVFVPLANGLLPGSYTMVFEQDDPDEYYLEN